MEKINVVTYCTGSSYGSMFQALGLKQALLELGYESRIIQADRAPDTVYKNQIHGRLSLKKAVVFSSRQLVLKKLKRRHQNTKAFLDRYFDIEYFDDYQNLCANVKDRKYFLAGSDQIWNPLQLHPEFFLRFVPEGVKKISYAASMGVLNVPEENKKQFEDYVSDFDMLSVREADCAAYISEFSDKEVNTNIDPTFLLGVEKWETYCREYPIDNEYILVYPLYWNKAYNEELKKLHQKTGLDIVVVASNYRGVYANKWVFDADPGQILWLIKNASAVVSSSFHGVAMSVIFQKKVAALLNPGAPSRIRSLLTTLGYPELSILDLAEDKQIDFAAVTSQIMKERMKGITYLKRAMESYE